MRVPWIFSFMFVAACEGGATIDIVDPDEPGVVTADRDADDDGSNASADCDDGDPHVHPGAAEACNGIDDNCNGIVDDGIILNVPCSPTYDTTAYPGTRNSTGECAPGVSQCDGAGNLACAGGKGPAHLVFALGNHRSP